MKQERNLIGMGILTAFGSSLCCITPVLALISGTSGVASTFSWIEPLRPYLIIFTLLVLGFAWFQKLKPKKEDDCGCKIEPKNTFLQSKKFLLIVTVFAIVMIALPYYSSVFYPQNEEILTENENTKTETFTVEGMTCQSCENHINYSVQQVKGVYSVQTSYKNEVTKVKYDSSIASRKEIIEAINTTGYTVKQKNK